MEEAWGEGSKETEGAEGHQSVVAWSDFELRGYWGVRRWFLLSEALCIANILHACQGCMSGPRSKVRKVNAQAWQPWGSSSCEMKRLGSCHLEGAVKLDLFGVPVWIRC